MSQGKFQLDLFIQSVKSKSFQLRSILSMKISFMFWYMAMLYLKEVNCRFPLLELLLGCLNCSSADENLPVEDEIKKPKDTEDTLSLGIIEEKIIESQQKIQSNPCIDSPVDRFDEQMNHSDHSNKKVNRQSIFIEDEEFIFENMEPNKYLVVLSNSSSRPDLISEL
jgi:hypothetical protein